MWVCVVYLENEPRNGFRESREEGQGRNVGSPTHVMEQVAAVGTQPKGSREREAEGSA